MGLPTGPAVPPRTTRLGMWPRGRRPGPPLLPQALELLAIIAFIFVSYHGLLWLWASTAPKELQVPPVVGLTEGEAKKVLGSAGLRVEVVGSKPDEKVPEGAVLMVEPAAGQSVKEGRLVRLTLSSGARWSVVPDVREMSVDRARALVRQARLSVGREMARYDNKVPIGYVVGQALKPGEKVPRGTGVDIWVSKGPAPEEEGGEETPPGEGVRSGQIEFTVPPGAGLQEVRIVVRDQRSERTVYRNFHEPGDQVVQTVSGRGPDIVVEIYLSGLLVQERRL